MRRAWLAVVSISIASCTVLNPAFEDGGDERADDTRGDADATGKTETGGGSVGDGDGDPSTGDGDSSSASDSSSSSSSSSSEADSSSSGETDSSSSGDSETSTSSGSDTSSDGIEACAMIEPLDPCLNCAIMADGCCEGAPDGCFDPLNPCGCVLKCKLSGLPMNCATFCEADAFAAQAGANIALCVGMVACANQCLL